MARDRVEREKQGDTFTRKDKRRPHLNRQAVRHFSSISMSLIATQRLRLISGNAVRLWLMANAGWTPKGGAALPVSHLSKTLHVRKEGAIEAIHELRVAELLTLRRAAIRPGRMGSAARGSAAVFDVTGRAPGTAHRRFEQGDRRLDGYWRILNDDLRELATMLTGAEARILVCCVLPCHRDRHGAPRQPRHVCLSGGGVADALTTIAARTANAAVSGLLEKGLIRELTPAAGRRAAVFEPLGLAAGIVRRGRKRSP